MWDGPYCHLCHFRAVLEDGDLCTSCEEYESYWRSLSPEERRKEFLSICAYEGHGL